MKANHLALAVVASVVSFAAAAQSQPPKPPPAGGDQAAHFKEHQAEVLKKIDEHLARLQAARNCVASAQDHAALRACRPEHHEQGHER